MNNLQVFYKVFKLDFRLTSKKISKLFWDNPVNFTVACIFVAYIIYTFMRMKLDMFGVYADQSTEDNLKYIIYSTIYFSIYSYSVLGRRQKAFYSKYFLPISRQLLGTIYNTKRIIAALCITLGVNYLFSITLYSKFFDSIWMQDIFIILSIALISLVSINIFTLIGKFVGSYHSIWITLLVCIWCVLNNNILPIAKIASQSISLVITINLILFVCLYLLENVSTYGDSKARKLLFSKFRLRDGNVVGYIVLQYLRLDGLLFFLTSIITYLCYLLITQAQSTNYSVLFNLIISTIGFFTAVRYKIIDQIFVPKLKHSLSNPIYFGILLCVLISSLFMYWQYSNDYRSFIDQLFFWGSNIFLIFLVANLLRIKNANNILAQIYVLLGLIFSQFVLFQIKSIGVFVEQGWFIIFIMISVFYILSEVSFFQGKYNKS